MLVMITTVKLEKGFYRWHCSLITAIIISAYYIVVGIFMICRITCILIMIDNSVRYNDDVNQ